MTETTTVINRPVKAVLEETAGISGFPSLSILVIGTDAWSRTGSDAWMKATTDHYPTCGETGQDSSSMKRSTFEAMTDVFASDRAVALTFVRIGDGEVVDGVAATHLRSDAGFPVPAYGTIPATTDLWIATAGGYPIRETIDGQGITATMGGHEHQRSGQQDRAPDRQLTVRALRCASASRQWVRDDRQV